MQAKEKKTKNIDYSEDEFYLDVKCYEQAVLPYTRRMYLENLTYVKDSENPHINDKLNLVDLQFCKYYGISDRMFNRYSDKLKLEKILANLAKYLKNDLIEMGRVLDKAYDRVGKVHQFHHYDSSKGINVNYIEEFKHAYDLEELREHNLTNFLIHKDNWKKRDFDRLDSWLRSFSTYFCFYLPWSENGNYWIVLLERYGPQNDQKPVSLKSCGFKQKLDDLNKL